MPNPAPLRVPQFKRLDLLRIFRSILISSVAIPVLIFFVFFAAGFTLLLIDLAGSGKYNNGWLEIVYAGAIFSYFGILMSTIPTIILGFPAGLVAKKYDALNGKVILVGATALGGIFLGISASFFFKSTDPEMFLWLFVVGGCGGMLNGYVFLRSVKPHFSFKGMAQKRDAP